MGTVVLSQYAHRRVQRGDRRFAYLVFVPQLVIYGILIAAGVQLSFALPLVGIPYTLGALVLVGAWVRAGMGVAKSTRSGKTEEEMLVEVGEAARTPARARDPDNGGQHGDGSGYGGDGDVAMGTANVLRSSGWEQAAEPAPHSPWPVYRLCNPREQREGLVRA